MFYWHISVPTRHCWLYAWDGAYPYLWGNSSVCIRFSVKRYCFQSQSLRVPIANNEEVEMVSSFMLPLFALGCKKKKKEKNRRQLVSLSLKFPLSAWDVCERRRLRTLCIPTYSPWKHLYFIFVQVQDQQLRGVEQRQMIDSHTTVPSLWLWMCNEISC